MATVKLEADTKQFKTSMLDASKSVEVLKTKASTPIQSKSLGVGGVAVGTMLGNLGTGLLSAVSGLASFAYKVSGLGDTISTTISSMLDANKSSVSTGETLDTMADEASQFGMSLQDIFAFKGGIKSATGVDAEKAFALAEKLASTTSSAKGQGITTAGKALSKVGLEVSQVAGLDAITQLKVVFESIKKANLSPVETTQVLSDLGLGAKMAGASKRIIANYAEFQKNEAELSDVFGQKLPESKLKDILGAQGQAEMIQEKTSIDVMQLASPERILASASLESAKRINEATQSIGGFADRITQMNIDFNDFWTNIKNSNDPLKKFTSGISETLGMLAQQSGISSIYQ